MLLTNKKLNSAWPHGSDIASEPEDKRPSQAAFVDTHRCANGTKACSSRHPIRLSDIGLFGPGRKALRHGALRFLTQPSSRGTGVVRFETSTGTPKFTARFCLGEMYWFVFSNADGSVYLYTHKPVYNVLVCENIV